MRINAAKLTADQAQRIYEYAIRHGRTWKASLRAEWIDCKGNLIDVRNQFGPTWLCKFSLESITPTPDTAARFLRECEETRKSDGLPPDPEQLNDDRAKWAQAALATFHQQTGTEFADVVCDLLADVIHWCDRHSFSFEHELRRGATHYAAETARAEAAPATRPALASEEELRDGGWNPNRTGQ